MRKIKLTQGKYALVDNSDFEYLNRWKWFYQGNGYAARDQWIPSEKRDYRIYMHRLIMNTPVGMDTDHINHNKLDNRRKNLLICDHSINMRNTGLRSDNKSGCKGVSWYSKYNKWRSRIVIRGKYNHLGYFDSLLEAGMAYENFSRNNNQ